MIEIIVRQLIQEYHRCMKINADWHSKHKMPHNPSMDERVAWHLEHSRHCSCRPLAGKMLEEIQKRGLK